MHKIFAVVAAACISAPVCALAAKTQADQDKWKASGKTGHVYGRSDGVFQADTGHSPYILENGTSAGPVGKGFYTDFTNYAANEGVSCRDLGALGTCLGNAALAACDCQIGDGSSVLWLPLLQQDIGLDMAAGALDVAGDQTDNDGAELLWGIAGASGKPFVIGRDPAFYMCTKVAVEDASGIDNNIMAGFVAIDTGVTATGSAGGDVFNADFEALDAYAGIGILGTAGSGLTTGVITIKTETDAARDGTGDGVTTTSTTDTASDTTYYTYCTNVSAAGAVTYTINGNAPTVTAAFSFVDGIMVIPWITYLHTNDVAGYIKVASVKVGYTE